MYRRSTTLGLGRSNPSWANSSGPIFSALTMPPALQGRFNRHDRCRHSRGCDEFGVELSFRSALLAGARFALGGPVASKSIALRRHEPGLLA